ncbi:MAG: deoxyribodipyrimidine photo-lyase, partial [Verrucomicrobia bacterium]
RENWRPGEAAAQERLERFLGTAFDRYGDHRDRPDLAGTSRLSPHLHFGEISPRQVWQAVRERASRLDWPGQRWRQSPFLTEIGWREFAHHLLWHFPQTPEEPLRSEFARFGWRRDPARQEAWQRGRTGYPIVDAAMRELWHTGWMHNRVRMIVASFLVKDLLIDWREGARWFWDTLVDADLANNTLGWQWTAGCGADAAPFFRIFNPVSQGRKFDPEGAYVRRWCPELAGLPARWIHEPHRAPSEVLKAAGVRLDATYPRPVVEHAIAREVALAKWRSLRGR